MTLFVLDTNIISSLLRRNPLAVARLDVTTVPENTFIGCPMVWHEVRRGLLARDARLQMRLFEVLFTQFDWQDYSRDDWTLAAQWWANRRSAGRPIADADLLIAVFTYNRSAVLITDNEKDFAGLGVTVENWLN